MAAKTIFQYCAVMLIYANKRENDEVDLFFIFYFVYFFFVYFFLFLFFFFWSKEAYQRVRQLAKITVKKAQAKVVKRAKNKSWVPRNPPPLRHLSAGVTTAQKFKSRFFTFFCHKMFRGRSNGLSLSNYIV